MNPKEEVAKKIRKYLKANRAPKLKKEKKMSLNQQPNMNMKLGMKEKKNTHKKKLRKKKYMMGVDTVWPYSRRWKPNFGIEFSVRLSVLKQRVPVVSH